MRVELTNGAWAEMRDPKTLKHGDRKKLYDGLADGMSQIAMGAAIADRLVAVLITEWSFDLIPPSIKIESLDELDLADYDLLAKAAEDAQAVLFPQLVQTVEGDANPKVTGGGSKG